MVDLFAAHQHFLRERLQYFLTPLHAGLYADVVCALEEPGKLLSQQFLETGTSLSIMPAGMWALLTFLVAQHVSPGIDLFGVGNAAVAVECFICGLDLLDDIEDEDQTPIVKHLGPARVLNVSTTLLMLAQQALLSLSLRGVSSERIIRLSNAVQDAALMATSGQHRDILAEASPIQEFTSEECLEIAKQKAGALMRLACFAGAICAEADDNTCKLFAELGELLGIASQLDNDSHDLYYLLQDGNVPLSSIEEKRVPKSVKTDLVRGKKTLPVVFAAKSEANLQAIPLLNDREKDQLHMKALYEGILATWGICLLYRERARDCLQTIEAQQHPISPALRFLLGFA